LVANGSRIIKDFPGRLAQAIAFYDQRVTSPDVWRNYATNTQFAKVLINLGRYMGDLQYGLDFSRFDNVELRITNTASSSTWQDTLAVSVRLLMVRPMGAVRPLGYLRTEVWREWTTVANEWTYLTLPTEDIIRRIILQADPDVDSSTYKADTGPQNLFYEIQHYLRSGEVEVFDDNWDALRYLNWYDYGAYPIVGGTPYIHADVGIDLGLSRRFATAALAGSYSGSGSSTVPTETAGETSSTWAVEAFNGDGPTEVLAYGPGYHNTAVLRHDLNPDPVTWLNPEQEKQVLLNCHVRNSSSAADGTNRVCLDRLVRY